MDCRTQVNIYANRDELSAALSAHVVRLAALAAAEQGRFYVAFSGGSLMDIISPPLVSNPLRGNVDWSIWHVFWADERWVPWSSPESNYGLAKLRFFNRVSIPDEQIHGADDLHCDDVTGDQQCPPSGLRGFRAWQGKYIVESANSRVQQPKLPVQLVNPSDGELQWFIDRPAAAASCELS